MANSPKRVTIPNRYLWLGGFLLLSFCGYLVGSDTSRPQPQQTAQPEPAPVDVMQELEGAKVLLAGIKPKDCSPELAETCLSLLNSLSGILDKYNNQTLTPDQQKQVEAFRSSLVETQKKMLPILRKSYAKVLADKMWEHNISVKVSGKGNRTLELVGATFAANRNMKEMNENIAPIMVKLRYTRIQYRWMESADATYFDRSNKPNANDSDVMTWTDDNRIFEVR